MSPISADQPARVRGDCVDCRGSSAHESGRRIIARYNAVQPGARFTALLDRYGPELRLWLLEAGVKHSASEERDDGWRIDAVRALSPAQGSIPGVHHLVTDGTSVWTCQRAARVGRIDAESLRVVAVGDVATGASHLVLDPKAERLFIADAGANAVLALRASDLAVLDAWSAPGRPQLPVVSPAGIVCVTGGRASGTVTIARPAGDRYDSQTIEIGACPHDPLVTADGEHLLVPLAGDAEIVKLRLSDGGIVGRCKVGEGPAHLAMHPDGTRIYSANSWDGSVSCMDVDCCAVRTVNSGTWAHAIDITPDGRSVWVANFHDDTIAVFTADTLERVALLESEPYAHGLDVSPDGRYVAASGFSSKHVRLYDALSNAEVARIEVGQGSSHTAFATDLGRAFIGCSVDDHVACVDVNARATVGRVSLTGALS